MSALASYARDSTPPYCAYCESGYRPGTYQKKRPRTDNVGDPLGPPSSRAKPRSGASLPVGIELSRRLFVTIGSIAGFRKLLEAVIAPDFLEFISIHGFNVLDVQCGPDYEWLQEKLAKIDEFYGVEVRSFQYTSNMVAHMVACRGQVGDRLAGCIISHAGSGTVLEALRYQAPLVVVPNPDLMDNHQAELAEECENQKWAVYGKLDNLTEAVHRALEWVKQGQLDALPPYEEPSWPPAEQKSPILDWMVLTSYPEELARQRHELQLRQVDLDYQREKEVVAQREALRAALAQQQQEHKQLYREEQSRLQVD